MSRLPTLQEKTHAAPHRDSVQTAHPLKCFEFPLQRYEAAAVGNQGEDTAYPQRIVATRPLYRLQDRFAQLSRLQRI